MTDARPATILVVDDNPATLYATTRVLRGAGFVIVEAESGTEAVEKSTGGVDLVVLDVNLPDFDGFEVCRRIRANPTTSRVPVIHLSATFVQDSYKVHGLEVGADGYLTHPVEPPVLIATINAFLRTRVAEDAMRRSEAKFKAVFDNALHGIALVSEELIYLDVNPALCRMLGRTRDDIVGKHSSLFVPADHEGEAAAVTRALAGAGSWRGRLPLLRPDGGLVQLEWTISFHSLPGVRLAIAEDVAERLATEGERERLLASERAARADAERANRLKDDFLATLSHELRTPLNAIVGWSQVLNGGKAAPEDFTEGLASIERNAKAQAQLIDDLLDVARITSGKLRLEVRPVDPAALITAALHTVEPAAQAKGISLVRSIAADVGPLRGDPSRLEQVVWNLVNNAVKFTPAGGRIEVKLSATEAGAQITVADNGQGIAPDLLPYLFDRFRQGDAKTTRSHGGLGLGLAIVKQLVELHGGTVAAASPGAGGGSTFTVTLPRTPPPAAPDPADPVAPRAAGAPPAVPRPTRLDGIRVLVVDDEPDARGLLNRMLRECGARVADAADVPAAVALLDTFRPHVLVSDIGMPGLDGYDLIREVRSRHPAGDLPAVALTAFARPEDQRRVVEAGYLAHVAKPFDATELTAVIAALAEGRGG